MKKEELIKLLEALSINEIIKFSIEFYRDGDWNTNRETTTVEMEG